MSCQSARNEAINTYMNRLVAVTNALFNIPLDDIRITLQTVTYGAGAASLAREDLTRLEEVQNLIVRHKRLPLTQYS